MRTHIGFGSPKQDSEKSHGEALGAEALRATKEKLGWPLEPAFHVPDEVKECCGQAVEQGANDEQAWKERFASYADAGPEKAAALQSLIDGVLPDGWEQAMPVFDSSDKAMATRAASGKALNAFASVLPNLTGGSADLAGSNKSHIDGAPAFAVGGNTGRNFHFGVREHAMGAAVNGMALPRWSHPLRRDISYLLGLHAPGASVVSTNEYPVTLDLYA